MSSSFCAALAWIALLVAGAAVAADADQLAPSSASSSADTGNIQEVVVTARRFSEDLQNVPIAVTALSAATLQTQAVTNLDDLNSFVPNFKIAADRATTSTINVYIRGVGQSDPLWGFEPGVGVYIDDVYLARPQAGLLDVLDVQDIEILRGPQGTLYGKNTIAGAIKYDTRDIAGPATLTVSATGGNYGEHDEKLSFSTPLIDDHVYFGLALARLQHYGYGEVVSEPPFPPSQYNYIGESVSNRDATAGRANLTITWGASSKLKIIAEDILDNSNASGGQRLNNYLAPQLGNPFDTRTDMPVSNDYSHRSGESATYTQSLTDQLTLKVVGAYGEGRSQQFIDFEELDANLFQVPGAFHDQQSSGEAQLAFTNDRVKAVGGVFYMDSTACGTYNASLGVLAAPPPNGFGLYLTSIVQGCVLTKSTAVYGDAAWKLTDQLNLDTGVRWNDDDKTARVYQAQYASIAPNQLLPGEQFFNGNAPPSGFFLFPSAAAGILTNYTNSRAFVNVSPRIGLDYHWTPRVMTYVSYSKGFKSGGFDMRGNAALYPQTENGYNSETADNYEAGVKSTLLNDTLLLNFTVFYDPYSNAQIGVQQFVDAGGVPQNVTAVLNAGKQINKGAELESVWRPIRPATFSLNVGYLDSYYENYLIGCFAGTPGCTPTSPSINVADQNRPINAPTWTLSGNITYSWDLSSGSLLARTGYDWRSFTKVANTTPSVTDQPAYGLLNAGVAFTTNSKAWRISIDAKNLTDRYYRTAGYDFGSPGTGLLGGVSQIGFYGPPRTYSGTVTYHY
ncbi:MAG TPA: TonB-dependent receptor [Steroidobacteraceae bacterium]|jgi:iron complex outermembrane receptor protein|nr:TonB-dependent receptor [Steroidobacteraceae bacterium]